MAWRAKASSAAGAWTEPMEPAHRGWNLGFLCGSILGFIVLLAKDRVARRGSRKVRDAVHNPIEMGATGWRAVLTRTISEFNRDQIPAAAAGATFFVLLSIFPALGAFAALYGLFADVGEARRQVDALGGVLPGGAVSVIEDQITRLASQDHGRLGAAFLISLAVSLWAANAGIKALIAGLNLAYEQRERRGFIALNLLSLSFTIGAIAFTVAGAAAIAAVPDTLTALRAGALVGISFLRWPALLVVVMGFLSLLYRYGPCRARARWRWVTPGSGVAAVGWMAMSLLFSWYVANFGHYNRTYGSLGAVIGFMTWIWLSLIVVLFGAELNAEVEAQAVRAPNHATARPAPGPTSSGEQRS